MYRINRKTTTNYKGETGEKTKSKNERIEKLKKVDFSFTKHKYTRI